MVDVHAFVIDIMAQKCYFTLVETALLKFSVKFGLS